ncbi:unnamed protein product [Cuscuta europaea]|uniref:feruloyl-CoA 6-hydroxylase n=1 Tax=Cuscuta europaea TaxID=41803 RepID=A0A9P1EKR2_CUSEU|nr:unnamed protein product [Cuscuta europaea]
MAAMVLSNGTRYATLPHSYVHPLSQRPQLSAAATCDDIPVIDLGCEDRNLIVRQIRDACRLYGFFQIINHGVPKRVVEEMLEVSHEFFNLSVEEKMKLYSDDPSRTMRLSTSFNITKETVHNWRDYLRLHCYPLEKYAPEWPSNPSSFKEVVKTYVTMVREVGFRIEEAVSESLGLDPKCIKNMLGEQGQHMAVNYYPPCPQPELTYGLPAHTDPNTLTILLQDSHVAGLQVLKEGKWLTIKPRPDAFVVNIGDQLQALSNGKYKSVWHRAIVNSDRARVSVASFLCPENEAVISAPESLTQDGSTAVYRKFTYQEYYSKFWSGALKQQHGLELFKN